LYRDLGPELLRTHGGIRTFMNWNGGVISDSGGFQVMSIAKKNGGMSRVTDEGVSFVLDHKTTLLTPELSVQMQFAIGADMMVVLDDFTPPDADYETARATVERTILWAKRSKATFLELLEKEKPASIPYLLGVVQGGHFQDLRKECAQRLSEIGFDGFGYGGWPVNADGSFDLESAQTIADNAPDGYFLYGLGIGKPQDIVALSAMGYGIFDCVLPTRDARHKRLYVYTADTIEDIDVTSASFYSYYSPKRSDIGLTGPVSTACDCLLCTHYSKGYISHLFSIEDSTALRLSTIHNLRFYSILMEKLQKTITPK
jgi:queuine tRNA-ribosyltransferase